MLQTMYMYIRMFDSTINLLDDGVIYFKTKFKISLYNDQLTNDKYSYSILSSGRKTYRCHMKFQ